jgi:hypothetical protein
VGGTSGEGSAGRLAAFKASFLNEFVREHGIRSVAELGCGDGQQLSLADYPRYIGFDVVADPVTWCRGRFAADDTKTFVHIQPLDERFGTTGVRCDLALSLDVIYHLLEDDVYETHMRRLFGLALKYVIIYSSNMDVPSPFAEVRHRHFTDWTDHLSGWNLKERTSNAFPYVVGEDVKQTSWSDFYVYERTM